MKYCSKCGHQLEDDMEFCPKCGTKQVGDVETKPAEPTNPFQAGGFNRASNVKRRSDNVNNNNVPSSPMQETVTIQDIENDLGPKFILCGILNMVLSVLGFIISTVIMIKSSGKSRQYIKEHGIRNINFGQYSTSFKLKYTFYVMGLVIGCIWPTLIIVFTL